MLMWSLAFYSSSTLTGYMCFPPLSCRSGQKWSLFSSHWHNSRFRASNPNWFCKCSEWRTVVKNTARRKTSVSSAEYHMRWTSAFSARTQSLYNLHSCKKYTLSQPQRLLFAVWNNHLLFSRRIILFVKQEENRQSVAKNPVSRVFPKRKNVSQHKTDPMEADQMKKKP